MGRKLKDGRSIATISRDSTSVIAGELSLDDWDDEELLMGRRKDKGGRFRGAKPKLLFTDEPQPAIRGSVLSSTLCGSGDLDLQGHRNCSLDRVTHRAVRHRPLDQLVHALRVCIPRLDLDACTHR